MAGIHYFSKELHFKLQHPRKTSNWINSVVEQENASIKSLDYIFCKDPFLIEINRRFLKQDAYTDIIAFDYSSKPKEIEGEIYISIDRVRENAPKFKTSFDTELHRVMIHGVLHLVGYKDKRITEISIMRKKEEAYLSLRN